LEDEFKQVLREVSERNLITLALVTNLSMANIQKRVGFSGIYFIANNGIEIMGPDLNVVHTEAKRTGKILRDVYEKVKRETQKLEGVSLENRIYSLVIRFEDAKVTVQRKVRLLMEEVWTPNMDNFVLHESRGEIALRPRLGWSKSRAILFVWNKFATPKRRPMVIYAGGDEQEEEIYSMLGKEGIGIIIGSPARVTQSKAPYSLKNKSELMRFLTWILNNYAYLKATTTPVS
jgi:trehalose-phosphatase